MFSFFAAVPIQVRVTSTQRSKGEACYNDVSLLMKCKGERLCSNLLAC
jgi:hypothetical protein